jgi:hypothetical protein
MSSYISFNIVVEFIALVFAFIFLRKDKSFWKIMITYLGLVVLTEITGKHLRYLHYPNQWVYNIFLLIEAGFVGSVFYFLLKKNKAWIFSGLLLFLLSYGIELCTNGFMRFLSYTNIVSSTIFIFYCLYYYYLLINEEDHHDLKKHAAFWWVTGAVFYYFGGTVCNIMFDYLSSISSETLGYPVRYIVFCVLNFILYSCWSYSFLCRYRQKT